VTTTLLAVDDSLTMRKVLEITFAGENFKTLLASSADEALTIAKRERPTIALLDHMLDGTSGYDLARELKSTIPGLAVILLSSKQAPFDKAKASATGVDDFMDKPFDTQKLLDKVAQVLSAPRAAAAPAAAAAPQPVAAAAPNRARPQPVTFAGVGNPAPVAPIATAPAPVAAAPKISAPTATPKPAAAQPAPQPVARPAAVAAPPAPTPKPAAAAAAAVASVAVASAALPAQLEALGLTRDQIQGVLALSREVVEKVVWEVVPVLAETLIKEEIQRLTSSG
jgi:CheY-like chemotaxis protein